MLRFRLLSVWIFLKRRCHQKWTDQWWQFKRGDAFSGFSNLPKQGLPDSLKCLCSFKRKHFVLVSEEVKPEETDFAEAVV